MDGLTWATAVPQCRCCATALHAVSTPEGLCRPCRAVLLGVRTAREYLEPIPYGRVETECMSCSAPALLSAVQGLEQALPARVLVSYRCVLCDLVQVEYVHITPRGILTVVGTVYRMPVPPSR